MNDRQGRHRFWRVGKTMFLVGMVSFSPGLSVVPSQSDDGIELPASGTDRSPAGLGPLPLVTIPSGTFNMGTTAPYNCQQLHAVTLSRSIRFARYEVTNDQYIYMLQWAYDRGLVRVSEASVLDNMGSAVELIDLDDPESEIAFEGGQFVTRQAWNAIQWAGLDGYDPANHPVKEVSWFGAASFCDWLSIHAGFEPAYDHVSWECGPDGNPYEAEGYRLPTEAEWEYVARYPDGRTFPWGNAAPSCELANFWPLDPCAHWSDQVGVRPLGAQREHPKPIYDLSGNVREWCNDRYECRLGRDPVIDPVGAATGSYRLIRGGSWDLPGFAVRTSDRRGSRAFASEEFIGFRYVRTLDP